MLTRERNPLDVPKTLNEVWSMDFMADVLSDGRKVRVFNVMDDCNREALAMDVGLNYAAKKVVETLGYLEKEIGSLKSSIDSNVSGASEKISRMIYSDQIDNEEWEQFSKEFSNIHQDFMERLRSQYGDFTNYEWRLISLLKMNLSSKDIANILRISPNGVKKARYRLRKKIDLASELDLQDFLISY